MGQLSVTISRLTGVDLDDIQQEIPLQFTKAIRHFSAYAR